MFGWSGTILRVDLTEEKINKEPLPMQVAKNFIGGSGIAAKILYDEVGAEVKPYDPENRLIFSTGPLTGTLSPASGRLNVTTKNPLSMGYGDSNSGGFWAPELKFAGYDVLVIQGKAKKPVYIWIDDDHVELRDASHLWGKTTWETEDTIREELGDPHIEVACIGPAGENIVRYACTIISRSRAPGWGGNGPVMGSKNLKAIAVRGSKGVKIARPREFEDACLEAHEAIKEAPMFKKFSREGQPLITVLGQGPSVGGLPSGTNCCYNFREAMIPEAYFDKCTADYMWKTQVVKSRACFNCPMHCSHWLVVREGPYAGTMGEGWEYNTQVEGYKMGIFNQAWVTKYNNTCNELSLDIDGAGSAIAWAMECYEKGIITLKDTDGIELTWGNEEVVLKLLDKIAHREGFGNLLAEGVYRASKKLGKGSERYAHYGKGGCEARIDHRYGHGYALGQAVSTRGPDHLKGCPMIEFGLYSPEHLMELGLPPKTAADVTITDGKAEVVRWGERISILCDSINICKNVTHYYYTFMQEPTFAKLISSATGWDVTPEELIKCANRINAIQKAYNCRSGVGGREEDKLPRRLHEDPIKTAVPIITRESLEKMKDEYYALRGWDVKTGFPTRESLEELGLKYVADDLEKQGVLGAQPAAKK